MPWSDAKAATTVLSQLAPWGLTLLCLLVGALLATRLARVRRRVRLRARVRVARVGERNAERLLRARGYQIIERQARTAWQLLVDNQPIPVELRADYLVRRDGEVFVAEVKTGEAAPSLRTPGTRRQLLEYGLAYAVAGTLLVDMTAGTVQQVRFPFDPESRRGAPGRPLRRLLIALTWTAVGALAMHALSLR